MSVNPFAVGFLLLKGGSGLNTSSKTFTGWTLPLGLHDIIASGAGIRYSANELAFQILLTPGVWLTSESVTEWVRWLLDSSVSQLLVDQAGQSRKEVRSLKERERDKG